MKNNFCAVKHLAVIMLAISMLLSTFALASANTDPIRIVVLPFYVEEGVDAKEGGSSTMHYRRMMGFMNNQFVRHGFEVISPFAHDAAESEYRRLMEIAEEDSMKVSQHVCKKYGVDAAYISWLKVKIKKTSDGYCKASAMFDGEAYDSAQHALGVYLNETFKVVKRDCDEAIAKVEKEIGDLVGRKLTAWSGGQSSKVVTAPVAVVPAENEAQTTTASDGGGVFKRHVKQNAQYVDVRLDGANVYELVEVFGKVVKTARGVEYAKNYSQQIDPDFPQRSNVTWRATVKDTDGFVLQANIVKMLNDISDAGGEIVMKGVPYRYTAAEVDMLNGIRPGDATSSSIQFVLDRDLARARAMSQTHDAYQARKKQGQGFE